MAQTRNLLNAATVAGGVAGPIFLISTALLIAQDHAGAVMSLDVADIAPALLLLLCSVVFGAVLAFPACLTVGSVLGVLAADAPAMRSLALWLMVGGAIGCGLMRAFGFGFQPGSMAFVLTAIACAAIVRVRLHWD